jgi:hypothetical protein
MTADSYKPTVSVVILPVNEEDKFKPGEEYSSPRVKPESGAIRQKAATGVMFLALCL